MVRYRLIRKYESGWVVRLKQSDVADLGIKDGDYMDIDDSVVISEKLYKTKVEKKK